MKKGACSHLLFGIIENLEYAAYNLCDKSDSEIEEGVFESTCPETTLFLAIRALKEIDKIKEDCQG